MGISYKPLRVTLAEKNIKITQLRKMIGCSSATMSKIYKDEPLNMRILEDIGKALNVPIEKIVVFT